MKINKSILTKIKNINLSQLLLGGLQMNSYKIPDEITKKVNAINTTEKSKDKLKEFYDKLNEVSSSFGVSGNTEVKPEKVELEKSTIDIVDKSAVEEIVEANKQHIDQQVENIEVDE